MSHRGKAVAGVVALLLTCGPRPAAADPLDDCNSSDGARMLTGCTAVLATAGTQEERLAALARRGFAQKQAGRCDAAIPDFTDALRIAPQSAAILVLRGECHATLRHVAFAAGDFEAALAVEPQNAEALAGRDRLPKDAAALPTPSTPQAVPLGTDAVGVAIDQLDAGLAQFEAMREPLLATCTAAATSIGVVTGEMQRMTDQADALVVQAKGERDRLAPSPANAQATPRPLDELMAALGTIATARQRTSSAKMNACFNSMLVISLAPSGAPMASNLAEVDRNRKIADYHVGLAGPALQRAQAIYAAAARPAGTAKPPAFVAQIDPLCTELATLQDTFFAAQQNVAAVRITFEPLKMLDDMLAQVKDPALMAANPAFQAYGPRLNALIEKFEKSDKRRSCPPALEASIASLEISLPGAIRKCWQAQAMTTLAIPGTAARAQAQLATLRRNVEEASRFAKEAATCAAQAQQPAPANKPAPR